MSPLSEALLRRVEEASLNASAPREQRRLDGWLLRFCPGKAKRARSIQPVAAGHGAVAEKWHRCARFYASVGLPPFVRITPFSEPVGVDAELAALGLVRREDARVMTRRLDAPLEAIDPIASDSWRFATVPTAAFAQWVGSCRGSSTAETAAHGERLAAAPVDIDCVFAFDRDDTVVAAGHVASEETVSGLYDIVTAATSRRRGVATALCAHLLQHAAARGADVAYPQVEAENSAARRIYERLGFADSYSYHYRAPP